MEPTQRDLKINFIRFSLITCPEGSTENFFILDIISIFFYYIFFRTYPGGSKEDPFIFGYNKPITKEFLKDFNSP